MRKGQDVPVDGREWKRDGWTSELQLLICQHT